MLVGIRANARRRSAGVSSQDHAEKGPKIITEKAFSYSFVSEKQPANCQGVDEKSFREVCLSPLLMNCAKPT